MPIRGACRADSVTDMRKETERTATIVDMGSRRSSISLEDIDFSTRKNSRKTSTEQVGSFPAASALAVVSSNSGAEATLNCAKSPARPQYEDVLIQKLKRVSLRVRQRRQDNGQKPSPASVQVTQVKFCLPQPTRPKGITKSSGGMMSGFSGKAGVESLSKIVNSTADQGLGMVAICGLLDNLVSYGTLGPRVNQAQRLEPKLAYICPPDCFDYTGLSW